MTRVLLAGADASVTSPLARALTAEGFEPTVVDVGTAALQRALEGRFRILVLDIELPEMTGLEVCRRLRLEGFDGGVIMVAPEGADDMALTVLETGGDDVVAKPFRMGDLIARMRALLRRGGDATVASNGLRLDVSGRRAWVDGEEVKLTAKEFELLRVLVRETGNVVSREELLREVWDTDWFSSTKTIDMHMSWLRRKLGDNAQNPRYITTIRGVGFRFERPSAE